MEIRKVVPARKEMRTNMSIENLRILPGLAYFNGFCLKTWRCVHPIISCNVPKGQIPAQYNLPKKKVNNKVIIKPPAASPAATVNLISEGVNCNQDIRLMIWEDSQREGSIKMRPVRIRKTMEKQIRMILNHEDLCISDFNPVD
jgi:hypothetical protein